MCVCVCVCGVKGFINNNNNNNHAFIDSCHDEHKKINKRQKEAVS